MGRKIDITGQRFGKLVVQSYEGNKEWKCVCDCGNTTLATGTQLRKGSRKSCGCDWGHKIDLTGQRFGKLVVYNYAGNKKWDCICDCGGIKTVDGSSLRNSSTTSCGCSIKKEPDLAGHRFGDWCVIKYNGKGRWQCKCVCGVDKEMITADVIKHDTENSVCTHKDLSGEKYWNWYVLNRLGENKYNCRCDCGKEEILTYTDLVYGIKKSCGCTQHLYTNLEGMQFGELTPIEYLGAGKWKCKCSCGKTSDVLTYYLTRGYRKDCGHIALKAIRETKIRKYGDTAVNKRNNPRTEYQLRCVESAKSLSDCINDNFKYRPYCFELCELLNLTPSAMLRYIHRYGLEHKINTGGSRIEIDIHNFIDSIYNGKVQGRVKNILNNKEIDIYMPDLRIGVEVNGDYWHSSELKDKYYHQNKTIEAFKNNIHLIHIFEYEWNDEKTRIKLKNYLKSLIKTDNMKINGRDCVVKKITSTEAKEFENKYHLQNYYSAKVHYGLFNRSNELIAEMSFGPSRFNSKAEWELLRYCTNGVHVHGGFSKLLKHFTREYKPKTIISYCDISKFSGSTYLRNGFTADGKDLSQPNYIWLLKYANKNNKNMENKVLSRYQTQKHRLVNAGLGTQEQTEDEIMDSLGYVKIYDSGNLKFMWHGDTDDKEPTII